MFGIGARELLIIGVSLLVVSGSARVGQMAREEGRFSDKSGTSMDEFKEEFTSAGYQRPARDSNTSPLTAPKPEESGSPE